MAGMLSLLSCPQYAVVSSEHEGQVVVVVVNKAAVPSLRTGVSDDKGDVRNKTGRKWSEVQRWWEVDDLSHMAEVMVEWGK